MDNSLLIERIGLFLKLYPKTSVETVHRGGKVFQRVRHLNIKEKRDLEVGHRGKLNIGEFIVEQKLPNKHIIRFTRGEHTGERVYLPKVIGEPLTKVHKLPEKEENVKIKKPKTVLIGLLPDFVFNSAAKRLNKLIKKDRNIKYLNDNKVRTVKILGGVHHPKKVKYNGIEAVFKPVVDVQTNKFISSKKKSLSEVCSYEIARALHFNFVPPTIVKTIDNSFGSVQQFVPGIEGRQIELSSRKNIMKSQNGRMMAIYDFIIGNNDRHDGNWMFDKDKNKIWAIDNGNSFPTGSKYHLRSSFIDNFEGYVSNDDIMLIAEKKEKIIRYIKSYFGELESNSAAKRIDYILHTRKLKTGWIEEESLR